MVLAARLREALGVPGMTRRRRRSPFRDKERMKQVARRGRPAHAAPRPLRQRRRGAGTAAEQIGFPLIVKPIAGAGSADTYRVDDERRAARRPRRACATCRRSASRSSSTATSSPSTPSAIDGEVAYFNVALYRPRPLVARSNEWISPQVLALRDVDQPTLAERRQARPRGLKALGFQSGFTHMEWYLKADGEVVFGEIGARPPGAHQVDQMNFACDIDVFREWGRAVVLGTLRRRRSSASTTSQRLQAGPRRGPDPPRSSASTGSARQYGDQIVWDNLLPVGARAATGAAPSSPTAS